MSCQCIFLSLSWCEIVFEYEKDYTLLDNEDGDCCVFTHAFGHVDVDVDVTGVCSL